MDETTLKILEILEDNKSLTNHSTMIKIGYTELSQLYDKLKELKIDKLVDYNECKHEVFKGEPQGKIVITQHGIDILNQYKNK